MSLTAGASGKLTINGNISVVGKQPIVNLKAGEIRFSNGISVLAQGSGQQGETGTITIVADTTNGTGTGNINLRDSLVATDNGGTIEITSTASALDLKLQGSLSAGALGTIVVRNTVGDLNVTLSKSSLISAGKVGLSSTSNITLDVATGQHLIGDLWVGQISAVNSFSLAPSLSGAAGHVVLGKGNNPINTLVLQNVEASNGLDVLASSLNIKGQVVTTGSVKLAAHQLDLGKSSIRANFGNIALLGFLDLGPESGKLTLFADQALLTASNQISIHANSLLFSGAHSVVSMNGASIDISGVTSSAKITLQDSILYSTKTNATLAVNAAEVHLNEGAQIVSSGLLSLSLSTSATVSAAGARGFLYGNSLTIQGTGSLTISDVDVSANSSVRLGTSNTTGIASLVLQNTRITANEQIVLFTGSLPTNLASAQDRGTNVQGLTTTGTVFLNNSTEPNRVIAPLGTSTISTSPLSMVIVLGQNSNSPVRFENASVESGVSEFRGISFTETVHSKLTRTRSHHFNLVVEDSSVVSVDEREGLITLQRGSLIVNCKRDITVKTPTGSVYAKRGSTFYVSASNSDLILNNLHDVKRNSVAVTNSDHRLEVPVGFEFCTSNSKFAKRNSCFREVGKLRGTLSEFSIPHLLKNVELVADLRTIDPRVFQEVLKMAACVYTVTATRGPYGRE